ncbi:hypothetical protein KEM54_003008, partial [Ascosphaera aggregata]
MILMMRNMAAQQMIPDDDDAAAAAAADDDDDGDDDCDSHVTSSSRTSRGGMFGDRLTGDSEGKELLEENRDGGRWESGVDDFSVNTGD